MDLSYVFPITGYTADKKFSIYGNDFLFTFMEMEQRGFHSSKVEIDDGFIRGYTHENNQIAIAREDVFSITGCNRLNTFCFLKSVYAPKEVIKEFDTIAFSGGVLNTLFRKHSLTIDNRQKGCDVNFHNDDVSYSFESQNETVTITIWSKVVLSNGWDDGPQIKSTDVNLTVSFSEKKPFSYAITCYHHICNCLRFMMNRNNVGFNSIVVRTDKNQEAPINKTPFLVYIHEDYECTHKYGYDCLNFEDLGKSFIQLYLLFSMSTQTNKNYSFGFFPQSDHDVAKITNNTIRSICAALEFEASNEPLVSPDNNPVLNELIQSTKIKVKEFRKIHDEINESTYSNIFSSINRWSFSARDRIQILWDVHKEAMNELLRNSDINQTIDIGEFIKYRNNITHGAEIEVTDDIATIAWALRGLIYCCVLKRIGIDEKKIVELCRKRINH